MELYIFGYGSLMNPASLKKTLPNATIKQTVRLRGYRRAINAPVNNYLYLNIIPQKNWSVEGVLIKIEDNQLKLLKKREPGYACVNVSKRIDATLDLPIYTFIAPNRNYPRLQIAKSYLLTCLAGKKPQDRVTWLAETVISNRILDDSERPVYQNAAVKSLTVK